MKNIQQINCPGCGETADYEVWSTINVFSNPELRERVLNGTLFSFNCPHCGHKDELEYPVLYNDMNNRFMIYFCDEEHVEDCKAAFTKILDNDSLKQETEGGFYRIVTNYLQLIEKIKIMEFGFDDRMIELYKLHAIIELNKADSKNNFVFAIFDLLENPEEPDKPPVPMLIFYNNDCKPVFDMDLTKEPNLIKTIRTYYNYTSDRSFQIDMDWADKYVTGNEN